MASTVRQADLGYHRDNRGELLCLVQVSQYGMNINRNRVLCS